MDNAISTIHLLRNGKQSIGKAIIASLKNAKEAFFCIAFLKDSGLSLLKDHIMNAANRNCSITFYVGTDFYQTEPVTLWFLFELTKRFGNFRFFLLSQDPKIFHPKIYLMLTENKATAIIGSSNLTKGGLSNNIEATTCVETSYKDNYIRQIRHFLSFLEKNTRSQPADPISISQYERRYDTYRKRIRKAEKEAMSEINNLFNLNSTLLKKYLKEYRADSKQQIDWRKRIRDYDKALGILNSFNKKSINSKSSFLDEYEKLVGKTDQKGLWHSGNILRNKNDVALHYRLFMNMLDELKKNIDTNPSVIFDIAKSHFDQINGLGCNVVTEILNTYKPSKFPILNKSPLSTLKKFGLTSFPNQQSFYPDTYYQYANLMSEIAKMCDFENLARLDHFMNFIYWKHIKKNEC